MRSGGRAAQNRGGRAGFRSRSRRAGRLIECRITAEDAEHDFRPAIGRVSYLHLPNAPGVRVDTFLTDGAEISANYDSLLAKVICYGANREEARRRMLLALDDVVIVGLHHTTAFLRDVIASEQFERGELSTHFVDDHFNRMALRHRS